MSSEEDAYPTITIVIALSCAYCWASQLSWPTPNTAMPSATRTMFLWRSPSPRRSPSRSAINLDQHVGAHTLYATFNSIIL